MEKWQWHHNMLTGHDCQIFFDVSMFLLSSLVTGPRFMAISLLVLESWQLSFIKDWPEIWILDFWPISGDWGELGIPNLAEMSLVKGYWMLENASYSFYHFFVIKGNPIGVGVKLPPTQVSVA